MASFADRNGGWWRNELPRVTASIQLSQDLCCDCGICWGSWETRRRYDGIASSVVATTQSEGQMCTSEFFWMPRSVGQPGHQCGLKFHRWSPWAVVGHSSQPGPISYLKRG